MKCEFCEYPLNHLSLKDVLLDDDELLFILECLNPYCNKKNIVSKDMYLNIRNDFLKFTQSTPYIKNKKLPYEMNIIFVSMERCGISWIIEVLSQVHKEMFGVPIKFNDRDERARRELSPVIATRKRFPLPQGWNSVYNVNPQLLIDRGYDKVIIVQREYNTMLKAHKLYEGMHDRNEAMLRHFDHDYDLVYKTEVNHMNCMKVNLEDLNSYTVATFKDIMDFLNFPEVGRPVIVPTSPPERNWEAWSSILEKGKNINDRLKDIDKIYNESKKDV